MFEEMLAASEPVSSLDRPVMAEMYRRIVTRAGDWRPFLDQHIQLLDVDITMGNTDKTFLLQKLSFLTHNRIHVYKNMCQFINLINIAVY